MDKAAKFYRLARTRRQALALLGVDGDSSDQGRLGASFERALANLWIAFQPIVRPSDQTVFGYEALLRSDEPSLPSPAQVIEAAERLGELVRLGRTIRNRAIERHLGIQIRRACW